MLKCWEGNQQGAMIENKETGQGLRRRWSQGEGRFPGKGHTHPQGGRHLHFEDPRKISEAEELKV